MNDNKSPTIALSDTDADERRELAAVAASVVTRGDISGLSAEEMTAFYLSLCKRLHLDASTQPLARLRLNGKEILYPTRGATDQLASVWGVDRELVEQPAVIDTGAGKIIRAVCRATWRGRSDVSTGAVPVPTGGGEALCNALLKCETKAKRRATLSILGLGMLDETEIETIPAGAKSPSTLDASAVNVAVTTAEAKAAAVAAILADYDADVLDGRDPDEAWTAAKAKGRELKCATELQRKYSLRERDAAEAKRLEAERLAKVHPADHPAVVALVDELASAETPDAVVCVAREHRDSLRAAGENVVRHAWQQTVAAWDAAGGLSGAEGLRVALRTTPKATPAAPVAPTVDAIVE